MDITGQKHGLLTAIKPVGKRKNGCYIWLFKCDCGNEHVASMGQVRSGNVKSCGCLLRKKIIDIAGQRFGRLTAIKQVSLGSRKVKGKWLFRCDCGNEITIPAQAAKSGNTHSCGCLKKEIAASKAKEANLLAQKACTTHGCTGTRLYKIYKGMKQRCYNSNNPNFKYYGGKGITICDEWLSDPQIFMNWALSHGYTNKLTIDRIDSDKGYCPDNCEFITQADQARKALIVRAENKKKRLKNAAS
jgi:hypothetical protein